MSIGSVVRRAMLSFAAAVLASSPTLADPEAAPVNGLTGQTVRILVGSSPGGGFDSYARMIAPHLARIIDGVVIVQNMPGAGGMLVLNRLYAAPPDGRTLMIVNGTAAALAQILNEPAARYDLAKVGHLGTISTAPWMWLVSAAAAIASPADAQRRGTPMTWSATGPVDGPSDGAAFTCAALKLGCRMVLGYPGSSEAVLAVARGEVDAIYLADNSAHGHVKSGSVRAIAAMRRQRSLLFPNVPTIFESARLGRDVAWLFEFRANLEDLGRILIAPPGMDPTLLGHLRSAVATALSNPDLVAEGRRTNRLVAYLDAFKTLANVNSVLGQLTPAQRDLVQHVVTGIR